MTKFDLWFFIGGLGLFLLGMYMLESSLQNIAGRKFKIFLQKHTTNKFKAILSGAFVTAILQSSSLVSLMILAFVGAGVLQMQNAIGVILGANLGTTMTGWLFTFLGFKINIKNLAFLFIGVGSLIVTFSHHRDRLSQWARLILGFGLLFVGLDSMKESISGLQNVIDLSQYQDMGIFSFFIIGFIMTAIIQSSSASMVITLSALNAKLIAFPSAAAIIIGSDLGTTLTVFFGTLKGSADKKRVALSHFLFNFITNIIALIFLTPLLYFITDVLKIEGPLIALVLFHSTFNLLGIIVFLPFVNYFASFLKSRFIQAPKTQSQYTFQISPTIPEAAIHAMKQEVHSMALKVIGLLHSTFNQKDLKKFNLRFEETYNDIKELEGEILEFSFQIEGQSLEQEDKNTLTNLVFVSRTLVSALKSIKDIYKNLIYLQEEPGQSLNLFFISLAHEVSSFFSQTKGLIDDFDMARLTLLGDKVKDLNDSLTHKLYDELKNKRINDWQASTLLNVTHEISSCNKKLLQAFENFPLK